MGAGTRIASDGKPEKSIYKPMNEGLRQNKAERVSEAGASRTDTRSIPLCVDLDGTLLKTDTLVESFLLLITSRPLNVIQYLFWMLKGRGYFKQKVADRVDLEVGALPHNRKFLAYLEKERGKGRQLILATAANLKIALNTQDHFQLFDEVLASDAGHNLKGRHKRVALVERFGEFGFDYAGNSKEDFSIWSHARKAVIVNPDMGVRSTARKLSNVYKIFDDRPNTFASVLNAMRVRRWTRNLLIFVPLAVSHKFHDIRLMRDVWIAFCCFCFCSSSLSIIVDLLRLSEDRVHPVKGKRPFAAGDLPIVWGIWLAILSLAAAVIGALFLPPLFLFILVCYGIFDLLYHLYLKNMALIDIIVLSGLYTLLIAAGSAAVTATVTLWHLFVSMLVFLGISILKRVFYK